MHPSHFILVLLNVFAMDASGMKASMFLEITLDLYSAVLATEVIPWYTQGLLPCSVQVKLKY